MMMDEDINKPLIENESDQQYGSLRKYSEIGGKVDTSGSIINDNGPNLTQTKTYKRRWYVLVVFSLMIATQGAVWNTWGPITRTSQAVFGWKDSDIALLSNWGPITYVISMAAFSWLIDVKGLRISCVITAALVFCGTGLRCITSHQPASDWLIHAGQILNGFGGPVSMAAIPLVSSEWFPLSQRITATAISTVFINMGCALPFILGPLLVREGSPSPQPNNTLMYSSYEVVGNVSIDDQRQDIMEYMYITCGWSGFLFLMMLLYFPAKPPTPPSASARQEKEDFKAGLLALIRKKNFWIVAIPYGISVGVYAGWGSVLGVNLNGLAISQLEAGWIGFYATVAGSATAFIVARLADYFLGQMKIFLLVLMVGATLSTDWMALVISGYIPFSTVQLYASTIMSAIFLIGLVPIFYEMACETSFPIAEGVTSGLLTFLNNVLGLVFLLILMIPNVGTMWMNWFLFGCCFFCFGMLLFLKEEYSRLKLDQQAIADVIVD